MSKGKPVIQIIILFLWCVLVVAQVQAQRSEDEVVSFLVGNEYKFWMMEGYDIVMGGSDNCIDGETLIFNGEGKVSHNVCENKKWVRNIYEYELEEETPYDWWISFNEEKYELIMTETSNFHEIKLRVSDSESKISEAKDKIYKFFPDE